MTTPATKPVAAALLNADALAAVLGPEDLARLHTLVTVAGVHTRAEELRGADHLADVEVLLTGWGTRSLDADLLAAMPSLRLVLYSAGSIRHLTPDDFWDRGITVVSAAEANNDPVAEFVVAATVLALKGAHRSAAHLRAAHAFLPAQDDLGIYERRIGLVGFGSIARKVATGLHRFGHRIDVWDPYLDGGVAAEHGVHRLDSLAELFETSQVLSIHAPWLPGRNDRMIGHDELRRLPAGATLINTARGALVDEDALVRVLGSRPDLQAVLDVTWPDPPGADSPLYGLGNVTLTGHIAGSVGLERRRLGRLVVDELERWVAGQPLRHEVTQSQALLRA
ncbi:hydroxyacid dehydrogenase [Occultella glacieicola]|uniref:Hydroxyacid dehydrogenase n=1 Tax=Occultella glacieicola TaxID=2518684 RepID=A0ABY2E6H2_9MICO|nr:hydroxyacid dehydrogenase [Occultella glacieicola]TDE95106.1 hydroxyacid dehydrogenase [Occultella glacieicola]